MDAWQQQDFDLFDCGQIDHVIALKFPAFNLKHHNKTVWLMHQHRSVYELYDTKWGENSKSVEASSLREKIIAADTASLSAARAVFTISRTVSGRLLKYNGIESRPLYQPPLNSGAYQSGENYPYIFFPSRLESLKRQDLLIRAMQHVKEPVIAIIAGEGGQRDALNDLIQSLGLQHRVKLIGRIDNDAMIRYYSNATAIFFGPYAEDYGFVTLEAMLSSKPVITCTDSGGPTEFVIDGDTGYVVDPEAGAVADAINKLWNDRQRSIAMGNNALNHYRSMDISWNNVVAKLLG
jgi:glycosyltransferase involved in cell wall biosynthesis